MKRILLVLTVIFVLMVSPFAYALDVSDSRDVLIPSDIGVSSSLIALGVMPGEDVNSFDNLVSAVIADDEFSFWISDSGLKGIQYTDSFGHNAYAVDMDFLTVLKDWLYAKGHIQYQYSPGFGSHISSNESVQIRSDGTSVHGNASFIFAPMTTEQYPDMDNCMGYAISSDPYFMVFNQNDVAVASSNTTLPYNGKNYYYVYWARNYSGVNPYDAYGSGVDLHDALYKAIDGTLDLSVSQVVPVRDVTLGKVCYPESTVFGFYSDWFELSETLVDGDTFIDYFFPVCISETYAASKLLNQNEAQMGVSSWLPSDDGSGSGGVIEVIDYTPYLESIDSRVGQIADASVLISGFLLFFVVVVLCYFAYKFFRIFF